jgi:hypothetical protein
MLEHRSPEIEMRQTHQKRGANYGNARLSNSAAAPRNQNVNVFNAQSAQRNALAEVETLSKSQGVNVFFWREIIEGGVIVIGINLSK